MDLKFQVHARYLQLVNDKIDVFQDMISALSEDAQNDAKSSAGDKHETALSMMQLEQEKLSVKLRECLEQKAVLEKIDPSQKPVRVALGSLVQANGMRLFISCALPKIVIGEITIFALSVSSPLGSALLGKQIGESGQVNGKDYTIGSLE